jgi:hypothetical protein
MPNYEILYSDNLWKDCLWNGSYLSSVCFPFCGEPSIPFRYGGVALCRGGFQARPCLLVVYLCILLVLRDDVWPTCIASITGKTRLPPFPLPNPVLAAGFFVVLDHAERLSHWLRNFLFFRQTPALVTDVKERDSIGLELPHSRKPCGLRGTANRSMTLDIAMTILTPVYSTLLHCVYDQPEPVGSFGGIHYSVFRCAEWFDVCRKPLAVAQVHNFAVIWDEDHDIRIIEACEKLYIAGLLSPVQFIGEHKGVLSVVIAARAYFGMDDTADTYKEKIDEAIDSVAGDYWPVEVGMFDRSPGSPHQNDFVNLIGGTGHSEYSYLKTIDTLWKLGTYDWKPEPYQV